MTEALRSGPETKINISRKITSLKVDPPTYLKA